MALPEPPTNIPRIVDSLDPGTNHHVVTVRMPTHLAAKYPDKPWGTSIADIGLQSKDSDRFPGYVLVDIEPLKGSADLYWVFQSLDASPAWTTKSLGQDSLTPAKYKRLVTTTRTKQEVEPDTAPTAITGDLTSSVVQQQDNTGKAVRVDTDEVIDTDASPLVGGQTSQWGVLASSDRVVTEGDAVPHAEGIAQASVRPFGNGKAEETKLTYPTADADGIIAEIEDEDQDASTGIITDIRKIMAVNTKVPALATALRTDVTQPWWVERKGQDQNHTVLIASRVDLTSLPPDEVFWSHDNINLPDTLTNVKVIWGGGQGGGNGTAFDDGGSGFSGTASANASAQVSATIGLSVVAGFRGKTKIKITRSYQYGPPTTALVEPYSIQPVSGSVSIISQSKSAQVRVSKTVDGARRGTSISTAQSVGGGGRMTRIGPFLNPGVGLTVIGTNTITTPTYYGSNQGAIAYASVSAEGSATLSLGSSSPGSIGSGELVARYQVPSKWRLGVWIVETVEVYSP